jgi:ubiquinone/menaquinone biosynthesis C-methylase UbiE
MLNPRDYWERCFKEINPETYDFSQSKPTSVLPGFCENYLKAGTTVLDLGCGGGRNAHYLAYRGYKVYGVDIATEAVEFCRKRFARYNLSGTFKQGTFDHIPFPNDYFTGVICIAALDHVTFECAQAAMAEIRRVLTPSGVVLLTFDPPDKDEDILDEAEVLANGTLKFVRGKQAGMLFHRYEDREIQLLLGEQHIISFDHTDNGARVIVCH